MKKLSLKRLTHIFSYGPSLRPTRDWLYLLGLAAVLLLLSLGWNVWFFMSLQGGKSFAGSAPTSSADETTSITSVQAVFQNRATEENNYQHSYTFVDPSLPGS